ncbi:FKBP-type peptidyl-prolyl cis-trans isomerase [Novipirellula artificiosorum]|nr:FKBP-type peptidyl-prolyl cis-trans isomerase [Novipirellula artificiosorum]
MAQETAARTYNTVSEEMGYFLGVSIGQQMGSQGFQAEDLDLKALVAGVTDGLNDTEPAMTDEQLKGVQGKIEALLRKRQEEMLLRNKEKGKLWLEQNAKKEGVKQLGEGLQYSVIKAGDGASPTASDTVKVHYTGKLLDGSVFDSSVQRGTPAEFRVGQVIKGWTMALQKMKVGDKWMLYIPSELAYGERGSQGAIGPNEVLIFEVELLGIE